MNNARKRATVKLIPRIDLQALAAKFVIKISCLLSLLCSFLQVMFIAIITTVWYK